MPRISLRDTPRAEFLGEHAEVIAAANPALVGIKGQVQQETKHCLVIRTTKGDRKVLKGQCRFRLTVDGRSIDMEGKLIDRRPEDRIKIK